MSSTAMLLSLPPEILSNILTFLSHSSVCNLERSSKTAGAAVLMTDFWRKQAENFRKTSESNFARNLLMKAKEQGYESPIIFKMIVRSSCLLDNMVEELKGCTWNIRDDISMIVEGLDHDEDAEDEQSDAEVEQSDAEDEQSETYTYICDACEKTSFKKEWKLEIIPVERKLEMAELDFVEEGIADIQERFVDTMKGPEPTLRKNCFNIRRAYNSEVEISIYCEVDEFNYPQGFVYKNCHRMWKGGVVEYGLSYEAESSEDDEDDHDDNDLNGH
eukprot:GFUD01043864.1.p1 GENE.GFUD01043864.1~~GFUD01043864.1.p1  ORF type:complete len:274 (+),score=82.22 GFUD01043864.1:27-848(+)